jgi:hypothetical protein
LSTLDWFHKSYLWLVEQYYFNEHSDNKDDGATVLETRGFLRLTHEIHKEAVGKGCRWLY